MLSVKWICSRVPLTLSSVSQLQIQGLNGKPYFYSKTKSSRISMLVIEKLVFLSIHPGTSQGTKFETNETKLRILASIPSMKFLFSLVLFYISHFYIVKLGVLKPAALQQCKRENSFRKKTVQENVSMR